VKHERTPFPPATIAAAAEAAGFITLAQSLRDAVRAGYDINLHITRPITATAAVNELADRLLKARELLIWCGGASDFAPEGKAREGWLRDVVPFLESIELKHEPQSGPERTGS